MTDYQFYLLGLSIFACCIGPLGGLAIVLVMNSSRISRDEEETQ